MEVTKEMIIGVNKALSARIKESFDDMLQARLRHNGTAEVGTWMEMEMLLAEARQHLGVITKFLEDKQ